jgi:hypothetical protein
MSDNKRDWILAGDSDPYNMFLGQLPEGQSSTKYMRQMGTAALSESLHPHNARLVLHQTVPLAAPDGSLAMQTLFKVMPFSTNPDGAHVVIKATTLIDVEGDAITKEMLMLSLAECQVMEKAEKARRSKITIPSITLARG